MQPQIDIELVTTPFCFLDRGREFDIWLKYRLHYREPITIDAAGSIFDPAAAFLNGRIEVIDVETGDKIPYPGIEEQDSTNARDDAPEVLDGLVLNPEEGSYFFWSTNIPASKWHECRFDMSNLAADRRYSVRYHSHGISHWRSGSHPTQPGPASDDERQQGDSLIINLIGEQSPFFRTRQTVRPVPPVIASLSTSTSTCSLSGEPPFTVFLKWQLDSDRAIYGLMTREKGRNIGLEIRDPERNGKRIGPTSDLMCGDEDYEEGTTEEEVFVRLGRPDDDCLVESHTLTAERKRGGLRNSDLWNLKSGKAYDLTLRKSRWRWLYDDEFEKDELQDTEKTIKRLREEPQSEWKPHCRARFHAE